MGATSTSSVKKTVRDLLQELPNLDGVDVKLSGPDDTTGRERIFFGDASFDHEPAGMRAGRTPRNEQVEVDVFVEVWDIYPATPEDVEERCVQIAQEFEQCVADNAGGTGSDVASGVSVFAITIRGGDVRTRPTATDAGDGFATQIQYRLRADARLT